MTIYLAYLFYVLLFIDSIFYFYLHLHINFFSNHFSLGFIQEMNLKIKYNIKRFVLVNLIFRISPSKLKLNNKKKFNIEAFLHVF